MENDIRIHACGTPSGSERYLVFASASLDERSQMLIYSWLGEHNPVSIVEYRLDSREAPELRPGELYSSFTGSAGDDAVFICDRDSSPIGLSVIAAGGKTRAIVLVNPKFEETLRPLLYKIESPVLILSSSKQNWSLRSQAMTYHDLISGSALVNVRSDHMNPLLAGNTQSFNAILNFLSDVR